MAAFNIRNHVHAVLTPMLADLGFKRREQGIYTLDLDGDFLGWLGLPDAVRDGEIAVNPVTGLRHQSVQAFVAQMTGSKAHGYLPPTTATALGFLLPDNKWREWYFDRDDPPETYEAFTSIVRDTAVPFLKNNANLASLEALLSDDRHCRFTADMRERLPVVKYLRGDFQGAISLVERYTAQMEGHNNPRTDTFRNRFALALIQLCAGRSAPS